MIRVALALVLLLLSGDGFVFEGCGTDTECDDAVCWWCPVEGGGGD